MNPTTYGLEIAKRVFPMHWVEAGTGEIVNQSFSKQELIEFLGRRSMGRVALEACGSAHWGCRTFRAKSGALILKIHIDQELAQSLIARKLPNGRALLQATLRAATASLHGKYDNPRSQRIS